MKLGFPTNFHLNRKLIGFYTRFSLYVTLGVVAVLILIGYAFLIGPKWREISSVGLNDYKREQLRLDADKEYLTEIRTLVAKYNAINQLEIEAIEQIAPTGDQLPALFVQMEAMAKDAGMELDSVTFTTDDQTQVVSSSALQTMTVNMQITGGARYTDMKRLIDTIEKNQRLLDLVSLSFSLEETEIVSVEGGGTEGGYTLVMRTYYLPDLATAPADQSSELETFLDTLNNQQP